MKRYKLTIAYDGTGFHGWQRQFVREGGVAEGLGAACDPEAEAGAVEGARPGWRELRTVQQVVQDAVRRVVREPVFVQGASRTDAGVHARGQVAAFSSSDERRGPADERLAMALSGNLPEDVLVLACEPVKETFDPIGDCESKGYRYTLAVGRERPLWDRTRVFHVWQELDLGAMRAAAAELVGEHDFAAFAAAGHGRLSTVRTVFSCDVEEIGPGRVAIDVSGSGFLYNMVRIIAGTLVEAGRGKMTAADVRAALASKDRRQAGPTLPPQGLCLEWIRYRPGSE